MSSKKDRRCIYEERMLEQAEISGKMLVTYEERKKKSSLPNRLNVSGNEHEEIEDMQAIAERFAVVSRQMLPSLLKKFSRIEDPRAPHKITHKMTVLLLYGILMFMFHVGSRRKANREIDTIRFNNLKAIFPELETMPHADTLARFLEKIEVSEIQDCMIELLKDLLRRKKFRNFLRKRHLLIAIDGTQKFYRNYQWDPGNPGLVRHVGEEKKEQHYVYVLESVIILDNGIVLPLLSEFLTGDDRSGDPETFSMEGNPASDEEKKKQDCERKCFRRLAARIKKLFRNTHITVLLDGLYACGPIIQICLKNNWDFMINLKSGAMPAVWEDALGIMSIDKESRHTVIWGDRTQYYFWANDIEYEYGTGKALRRLKFNVVVCYEKWTENHSRSTGKAEEYMTRYAWLSSKPLNHKNIFNRCTKLGRYRWKIENNILTEKHQGYCYEHCYSYTWNAMEGYHYLMKIGRLLNVLAVNSELLIDIVQGRGIQGFVEYLWEITGRTSLNRERIREATDKPHQWRLAA
ncbi:MAG: transposase family protein [Clostridia bacterium]|nr:transposase family protein [Clostridia bacterium]MDD4681096.1 transposase family protein [Clostridia bacterium]